MGSSSSARAAWDAAAYDRLSDPQVAWGQRVLARLALAGDETVLDAGCGSGRLTALLLERLPRGRVIAVDKSPAMLAEAERNLCPFATRVSFVCSDLTALELDAAVDVVVSTATFHWILDHDRLFARLAAALRPGGRIEAQCGGEGNVAEWKRAIEAAEGDERFSAYLRGVPPTYNFASVGDTRLRLLRAGFEEIRVWLEPKVVTPREPRQYVRSVGLAKHLDRLPPPLREDFVDAVLGTMPRPLTLAYVRLNISARRCRT